MARKKAKKAIQTDRSLPANLPNKYSAYRPHRGKDALDQPGRTAASAELEALPKSRWRKIIGRTLLIFLVLIISVSLIIGVWDARNISSAERKMFGTSDIFSLINSSALKGSPQGRVNILLIGYSVDDPGHSGAKLTDSLILLSLGTAGRSSYMLSIPRDLYVNIPGFGHAKINEAYEDGGVGLLEKIISRDFQVPLDYYMLINYAAVRGSVDALGGITVDIKSTDPRGLFDPNISKADGGPLKLSNGPQLLDGQTALNLTRARGDPCLCGIPSIGFEQGDFARTEHQRQVFAAIKAKLNWKLMLDPRKNGKILNAFADNLKTDIKAAEARPLFGLFNSIPDAMLKSYSLRQLDGHNYLSSYTTPYGQSALIPSAGIDSFSQIAAAVDRLNR